MAGLSAVWIVYVGVANLFLNLGGVQRLLKGQNTVELTFDAAFTYWPGEVHVSGYRMVFQDPYVEWSLELPRAEIVVDLRALSERRFQARSVRGSRAAFRLRHRIDPADAELRSAAALPPIPEFGRVPLSHATVPVPPVSDADYRLWSVRLDDVDLELGELWIQQVRYLGSARVRGGFELRPLRTLWVGPATLELSGGRVLVSDLVLASALSGTIACTMPLFDVREPEGRSILRHVSGRVALRGSGVRADPAVVFLSPGYELAIESRPGDLLVDARLERGSFDEQSRVELRQPFVTLSRESLRFELTDARLLARGLPGGRSEAVVQAGKLELVTSESELPGPVAEGVRLGAESSSRDVAGEWRLDRARFDAPDSRVPELAWLNAPLRAQGFRFGRSGSAKLGLSLVVEGRKLLLDARGNAERVHVRAGGLQAGGTGRFELRTEGDRALERARALARLDFEGLLVEQDGETPDCPVARAERARLVSEARLVAGELEVVSVAGELDRASLRWGETTGRAEVTFDVSAREGDAVPLPGLLVAHAELAQLELDSGAKAKRGWHVRAPAAKLVARLRQRAGTLAGTLDLEAKRSRLLAGDVPIALDLDAKLAFDRVDPESKQAELAGAVRIANASASIQGSTVKGYWAEVELGRAKVSMTEGLELSGRFSARLRDGVPGLLLLEKGDEVPGWLEDVLPLKSLRAHGRVEHRCRLTEVYLESASGGPLEARGRVQATPDGTRGALLVELSGLELVSAGLSFGVPDHGVELFAGDEWLAGQSRGLAARLRHELATACAPPAPACRN